jgi:hypothetical protein
MSDPRKASLIEPCPECLAGKCGNCDGRAWDQLQDEPAECPCARAGHPRGNQETP